LSLKDNDVVVPGAQRGPRPLSLVRLVKGDQVVWRAPLPPMLMPHENVVEQGGGEPGTYHL
jgi:hypothetical protein